MTDKDYLKNLRTPTVDDPLRILTSACLVGTLCGADGSSYGNHPHIRGIESRQGFELSVDSTGID